jgi:hypothetical protein
MGNPFFKAMGGANAQQGGQRNLAPSLLHYIQGFQGNPMEQLQSKLNSGEMSQDQYNQLHSMAEGIAQQMMQFFPHR